MGGSISSPLPTSIKVQSNRTEQSPNIEEYTVNLVLPIYYTKQNLTEFERSEAFKVWKLVTSSKAPLYLEAKKKDPNFPYPLCSDYFYAVFFERLIDIHPTSRNLFQKSSQRMRQSFLSSFGMILNLMDDPEKFQRCLVNLAHVHNKIGIKAIEYGIVGEIILYTLRKCCGDSFSTAALHGWAKILSKMLDIILPVVVKYEVENGEVVREKFAARFYGSQGGATESTKLCPHHQSHAALSHTSSTCPASLDGNSFVTKGVLSREPSFV